ncbi:MAG TPA: pyruvate dehydrogenase complex dihydrolipoamide acetyltransferase [Rhizomicrobium sp.]|nr:pyruvate dehydrogenase complex dihydrolipoamide acetyltransferase [Rhizomicrobium sp.]
MPTQILMPALSPTMEEGKLARWLVKEGDEVRSGDLLAEIETDKATMEFEAVDEGRIGKILVPEGTEGVKVNQPIALLLGDGEESSAVPPASATSSAVKPKNGEAPSGEMRASEPQHQDIASAMSSIREALAAEAPAESVSAGNECVFASPLARRMAQQAQIDISAIKGSGPRGRIVKADVEAAEAKPPAPQEPGAVQTKAQPSQPALAPSVPGLAPLADARLFYKPEDYEEVPHDAMRKSIARRLLSAKTLIPHYYLTVDCHIDELLALRTRLNAASPKGESSYKLSVNDFVVKASALALLRVPEVNASWTDTAILRHRHADVGVAVALNFGLITPIVYRADEKGLAAISNEVKSLAERARARKLKPQEYEGGSFAISNLGMFGIKDFTAIINPPHAAIIAVGAAEQRAIVRDGRIEAANMMTVTMSCDHRVIDGATGARFLGFFRRFVEDPAAMLL